MSVKFIEVDREAPYLLPPSLQDWLPKGHLARFVVEIVEQLDVRSLKKLRMQVEARSPITPRCWWHCCFTVMRRAYSPAGSLSAAPTTQLHFVIAPAVKHVNQAA
jgi:hypothetical protein